MQCPEWERKCNVPNGNANAMSRMGMQMQCPGWERKCNVPNREANAMSQMVTQMGITTVLPVLILEIILPGILATGDLCYR